VLTIEAVVAWAGQRPTEHSAQLPTSSLPASGIAGALHGCLTSKPARRLGVRTAGGVTEELCALFADKRSANSPTWCPCGRSDGRRQIPKLSIYPNAGHGFLFQCSTEFAAEVNAFLG
jgi:pimeloyl-ACP methyl ester carboxylesterase